MNVLKYRLASTAATVIEILQRSNLATVGSRVLMYHDLDDRVGSDIYSLKPSNFKAQISSLAEWLNANSIPFVSIDSAPIPGVAVTFDDGYTSTLKVAAPLLEELQVPFHVFVTKDFITGNDERYMSESMLQELSISPLVSIGCHGVTHRQLGEISSSECIRELRDSRSWLESLLQRPIRDMSYPNGSKNPFVVKAVAEAGFDNAFCSDVGTYVNLAQRLEIPRIDIWSLDSVDAVRRKVRGSWEWLLP